jgi:Beta-ketoacyl synthase, N-terminal domain
MLCVMPLLKCQFREQLPPVAVLKTVTCQLRAALLWCILQAFDTSLPATVVFDYPSISAIAAHIMATVATLGEVALEGKDGANEPRLATLAVMSASNSQDLSIRSSISEVAARYPCSRDGGLSEFWEAMTAQAEVQRMVPLGRWDVDALYSPDPGAMLRMYVRHGGFVDSLDMFDATTFRSGGSSQFWFPVWRLLFHHFCCHLRHSSRCCAFDYISLMDAEGNWHNDGLASSPQLFMLFGR